VKTKTEQDNPRSQNTSRLVPPTAAIWICVALLSATKLLRNFGFTSTIETLIGITALLAAAGILAHAIQRLCKLFSGADAPRQLWPLSPEILLPASWAFLALAGFIAWPSCMYPQHHPIAFLFTFGAVVTFPMSLSFSTGNQRRAQIYAKAVVAVYACLAVVSVAGFYFAVRPHIQGLDFFYYICYARDQIQDNETAHMIRYAHFPGIYAFWRSVMLVAGQSLGALQWAYIGLLFANALAVAGVIRRLTGSLLAPLFGAVWYAVLCTRFEGTLGVTEPLCSLPLLCSLWYWAGRPLRDRNGIKYAVALGAGLALCLYGKQQGGLLWMGAFSLLPGLFTGPKENRHQLPHAILMGATAVLLFFMLILLEGHGIDPLRIGLGFAKGYKTHGAALENLRSIIQNDETIMLAGLFAFVCWILSWFASWARRRPAGIGAEGHPRQSPRDAGVPREMAIAGFAILAASGTLVQVLRRPYVHYALLSLPFIVVAAILAVNDILRRLPDHVRKAPLTALLLLHLAALPLLWGSDDPGNARLLRDWLKPEPYRQSCWYELPDVSKDLAELQELVPAGTDLLVIPPRRSSVHFVLGTIPRSFANGYNWALDAPLLYETVSKPSLQTVLIINNLGPGDQENWNGFECDKVVKKMRDESFKPVVSLKTVTLWRKQ
jgi:hypothetical protein